MSQRGKRVNHLHHPRLDVEPQPPPTKRRKGRPPNGGGGGVGGGLGGGGAATAFTAVVTAGKGSCPPVPSLMASSLDTDNQQLAPPGAIEEGMSSTSVRVAGVSQGSSSSAAAWQARSVADIKISSIYNRSSTEAPAELYR